MGLSSGSAQYHCLKLRDAPTGGGKWCYLHCMSCVKVVPWCLVISSHEHISLRGAGLGGGSPAIHCAKGSVTCCFLSRPTV